MGESSSYAYVGCLRMTSHSASEILGSSFLLMTTNVVWTTDVVKRKEGSPAVPTEP